MCNRGVSLLHRLMLTYTPGGLQRWTPHTILRAKTYSVPVCTESQESISIFNAEVAQIVGDRAATMARCRDFQILALIPMYDGDYERYTLYQQKLYLAGTSFGIMYDNILHDNPTLGNGMFYSGMFITDVEQDQLVTRVNETTLPDEPIWLNDPVRRFTEAHRVLDTDNDNIVFYRLTDMQVDIRYLRILFMPVASPFPRAATRHNHDRDLVLHIVDGTFSSVPVALLSADKEWDYPMFLSELLIFLRIFVQALMGSFKNF